MKAVLVSLVVTAVMPGVLPAQQDDIRAEYRRRVGIADADTSTAGDRVLAAEAARYMRRFDEARHYLRSAQMAARAEAEHNAILTERLWMELATGGGVEGVQRIFADETRRREIFPTVLAGWVNNFPELLVGGQYDLTIDSLAGDATDPLYRCDCFAPKAWMHRVAGRMATSRAYWDSLVVSWQRIPDFATPFNYADWLAQRARNNARAGDADRAREQLAHAQEVDLHVFDSGFILRRRAQTYAELGDIDELIADLEMLLSIPSPVTVHTLQSRVTWSGVRDHPLFRALLDRHR